MISLIDNEKNDLAGKRIGLYSYGSGSIGEFFSGKLVTNYSKFIDKESNQKIINNRKEISVKDYESWYQFKYPEDGSEITLPKITKSPHRLIGFKNHIRIYE